MQTAGALVYVALLSLLAGACTGEIEFDAPADETDPPQALPPETPPEGASDGDCEGIPSWDAADIEFENRLLGLINDVRQRGTSCGGTAMAATHPLSSNGALLCAARKHSKDMHDREYFSHFGPEGDGPEERIEREGYSWGGWGENIIAGYGSPEAMLEGWLSSTGHCRSLMSPDFVDTGLGYYYGPGGYGHYATQVFARPR